MKKWIVRLFAAAVLALAGVWALVVVRYPGMSHEQAARYVVARVASLAREHMNLSGPYAARESAAIELANVRKLSLEMAPELADSGPLDQALILNRLVHKNVPVLGGYTSQDFSDFDQTVWRALRDPRYGHLCQGLSFVYMTMLKSFGIKSRFVGLYQYAHEAPDPVNSHASVDVRINGDWVALDPSFNMSLRDGRGRMLGWADAREMVLAGQPVTFADEGARPGWTLSEYYGGSTKPFLGVFNFAAFGPGPSTEAEFLPAGWDGLIHYAAGHLFQVKFGRFYYKLSSDIR